MTRITDWNFILILFVLGLCAAPTSMSAVTVTHQTAEAPRPARTAALAASGYGHADWHTRTRVSAVSRVRSARYPAPDLLPAGRYVPACDRNGMASRFQPLIATIASVKSTSAFSSKCRRTSA
jgi:hypothetical protein